MMKKRLLFLLLCFALLLPVLCGTALADNEETEPMPVELWIADSHWELENNTWYFVNSKGEKNTGLLPYDSALYYLDPALGGAVATGWREVALEDTTVWYYFDPDGKAHTGWLWDNGSWYYFYPNSFAVTGYQSDIGGKAYYFNASGALYPAGWFTNGYFWFYVDQDGSLHEGWLQDGGNWYYFDPDNSFTMVHDQLRTIDGEDYYFTSSGAMATGWQKVLGAWNYFDPDGARHEGWLWDNGDWYYLQRYGMVESGVFGTTTDMDRDTYSETDFIYYSFDSNGRADGTPYTGWAQLAGSVKNWWYCVDGRLLHDEWALIDGRWYYLDEYELMVYGVCEEHGGKNYVFTESGALSQGGWVYCPGMGSPNKDRYRPDGHWYYAEADGTARTGWLYDNGTWYYLDPDARGAMATSWKQIGGAWYWFYPSGAMAADETVAGYSFDASGAWIK